MNDSEDFVRISSHCINRGDKLPFDVYAIVDGSRIPVLYIASGAELDSMENTNLIAEASNLFIQSHEVANYQSHVQSLLLDDQLINTLEGLQRTAIVSEAVRFTLYSTFRANKTSSIVASTRKLGAHISELMNDVNVKLPELQVLLHHDYGTFTHSTNVAFYATLLAKKLNIERVSTEDIAIGGLLHDVGKLSIDVRILNKPSKLDDREFRIVKQHPLEGYRRLTSEKGISKSQLLMAYQHHEKIDGSGYPVGLTGKEISLPGKICAVVDVYEALTSQRPYRHALSPNIAMDIMEKQSGEHFDRTILDCWKAIVLESSPTDQLCRVN